MSNINRISGVPNAIVIKSDIGEITDFSPPLMIDVPPNTTIVGHLGDKYPGTVLPSNGHIRLVEFYSEHIGSIRTVALRYHTVRLSTAPEYQALSYCWGPMPQHNPIQGVYFTDSLLSALVNLAECDSQFFWIDALCINQSDLSEKPEQIRMMRQIYEKAKKVCVWLGEPDTVTIDLLQKITSSMLAGLMHVPEIEFTDAQFERLGLPGLRDPAWQALMRFLSRPYFRRVWVLQELVMASHDGPVVACGRIQFSWHLISLAGTWLRENQLTSIFMSQTFDQSKNPRGAPDADLINLSLTLADRRDTLYLEYLIGTTRYLDATNPRDKIIALLGLVTPEDESKSQINIDYRQPVADFYRETTGEIINTHRSLKLLSLVTDKSSSQIPGLPSWVPDYSIDKEKPSYRWAHFTTPGRPVSVDWRPGSNELHIWGQMAGEVQFVAEDAASFGSDAEDVLVSWFRAAAKHKSADEWKWILSLANSENEAEKDADQFWRTVILDVVDGQSPAPQAYKEHFAALVFQSYLQKSLQEGAADTDWLISLGTNLAIHVSEMVEDGKSVELDDMLDLLIELAMQANQEGVDVKYPDWSIPKKWISLNEDNEYTLGPPGDNLAYISQMTSWGGGRFFITKDGRMGKGPIHLQVGDKITIVDGTEQVFLLRAKEENFQLVGECYVHGLMKFDEKGDNLSYEKITLE